MVKGYIDTDTGEIPVIDTKLCRKDILGSWKVRWNIARMEYKIKPGVYAVGNPDKTSPVLVSANYKLSFDMLRQELAGLNVWIMVIDTNGINVWCAAGKGTFGTQEILNRIKSVRLSEIVTHKEIILPQLGAPGVSGSILKRLSGFKVIYGPIYAKDIKAFFISGMKADKEMRSVKFTLMDRLILTPVELVSSFKILFITLLILFAANLIHKGNFNFFTTISTTLLNFIPYLGSALIGCIIVPILLPFIPGSAFSWKGFIVGLLWALYVSIFPAQFAVEPNIIFKLATILTIPALSSYFALNFTGCTTYTSLSGVNKEMKIALPGIIISLSFGILLVFAGKIIELLH